MNTKFLLKLTSSILSFILLISSTSYATINNTSDFDKAVIDNEVYVFTNSVDRNGNTKTIITNLNTNTSDVLTTNDDSTEFYLNGGLVATVSEQSIKEFPKPKSLARSDSYTYIGTTTKNITWIKATTTAVVAGVIAAAIGITGGAVIAVMGLTALGVIAAQSSGGKITTKTYEMRTPSVVNYKFVWNFTASTGDSYGPFTSYTTV